MATDVRQNPSVQAELDIIRSLHQPHDQAVGFYGMTPLNIVDAHNNGVRMPKGVAEMIGDWESKSLSDRYATQQKLHTWMQQHGSVNNRLAENYYEQVVRPRAGGSPHAAAMFWSDPGATMRDLESLGIDAKDLSADPRALQSFISHVEQNGSPDRQARIRSLKNTLPLIDYARTIDPRKPESMANAPQQEQGSGPVPYPTMDIQDPWMQHGHAIHYQEQIAGTGDILGTQTMRAAVQLQTSLDKNPMARRMLSKAYGTEALEPAGSPADTALEFGVAPYGLMTAAADVIEGQFEGDLSFTERLRDGMVAAPLLLGGIFAHRFSAAGRAITRGKSQEATPQQVQEAKDVFTEQLLATKTSRQGAEKRLADAEAAKDLEGAKKARREVSQARREEGFLETILDNERGEAEIRRLEYWKRGLQEEGAAPSLLRDVDKRIDAAQKRLADAKEALRLPTKESLDSAIQTWKNLKESAKVPDEQLHQAAEQLVKSGKVSLETIMARDIDAALNPVQAQAEAMVANKLADHVEALAKVYTKSNGSIIASNELVNTLASASIVLGKVRRSDTRLGQSVHALAGKSDANKALLETVEGMDNLSVPAFAHVFRTAKTDIDRVSQLKRLSQPGVFKGSAMQMLTNNLISSPATAFWNVMSMGAMTVSRMNELRLLGKLDPSHFAKDEAGVFAQALIGFYGRLRSGEARAKAAWDDAFDKAALRSANVDEGVMQKYNFRTSISSQAMGVTGAWGRAVDAIGYVINLPTQVSAWADAMVSVGIKDAMAKTLAHRQAVLELHAEQKVGAKLSKEQIRTRLAAREQEILSDPNASIMVDGKATLIRDIAAEDGAVISMMGKLNSHALGGVEAWMNNSLLARMVIPFPHPFLQTAEMALERTPIGRLLPHMKADLAAGGARAAAARAKLSTGNQTAALFAAFAGMAYMADEDGESDWIGFTGSGPFNQNQKSLWAATHRADTLRIAGKEFPLGKLGPVGQVMSATADAMGLINEAINAGDKEFSETALNLAAHLSATWTNLVVSELFAADVKDLMQGLVEGDAAAVERIVERKGTMLVPAGAALKTLGDMIFETRQIIDRGAADMKFITPLNFWGDPTRYYGTQNPLSTMVGLTERNAPDFARKNRVAERLIADDVGVTAPGRHITFKGVSLELSLEQMYAMRDFFANAKFPGSGEIKAGTLLDGLESMIAGKTYNQMVSGSGEDTLQDSRMGKGSKQDYINMYVSQRKAAAAKWLIGESKWKGELQGRLAETVKTRMRDLNENSNVPKPQSDAGSRTRPFAFSNSQ